MRSSRSLSAALVATATVVATAAALTPAQASTATSRDVRVTVDSPYVKANGRAPSSGDAITACGQNRRQQNEPSAAMDPRNSSVVIAGSNDYCTVPIAGGTWTGYYRSTNGGSSWTDSLLPGYPTDNSPEGVASPLHKLGITNAGDPVQSWDNDGRAYYMGNAFNRTSPQNASVWVATYDNNGSGDGNHYVRTVLVSRGTPAPTGKFNDKTAIETDRGAYSSHAGNVYVAWSVFQGNGGNNAIYFARSTDHGATFSQPKKVSVGVHDNQFADIAVTSKGTVYVAWREFETGRGHQRDAVVYARSTDGGVSFTKPAVAQYFESFDAADSAGSPTAAATAHDQAYRTADGPAAEAGEASAGDSRDCGSGPFACQSGFVFFRHDSQPRITADPKSRDQSVYLAYDAIKGNTVDSTTTYNTAPADGGPLQVGQGAIFYSRFNGTAWSSATPLDSQDRGHQFFADINADGGYLHAVWHDSRNDPAYSVQYPPANNGAIRDAAGFATPTRGLDTYGRSATLSTSGAVTWGSDARLSATAQMPNYEMFGDRRVPFHGDYNYVTSVGPKAYSVWTDTRDSEPPNPGDDPRYTGGEGFDVFQTRSCPTGPTSCGADTTPSAGGLDQDIFGAATTA